MNIGVYVLCLIASFGVPTLLGAPYKAYTAEWYKQLKKPSFAFPDIVFIVIFPVFYFIESIGLYRIVTSENVQSLSVYAGLFLLSALLSGLWSRFFFVYKRCDYSLVAFFVEIPVTILFVLLLTQESHLAWIFFLPRMLWGFYAIFANVQFFRLNTVFWNKAKTNSKI